MKKIKNINNTQNGFEDAPKGEFKAGMLNIVFDPDADGYLSLALYQKHYEGVTNVLIKERDEQVVVPAGIDAVFLDCHPVDGDAEIFDHHAPYTNKYCACVQVAKKYHYDDQVALYLANLVQVRDLMQSKQEVWHELHITGMALSHYLFNSKDKTLSADVGSLKWWDYLLNLPMSIIRSGVKEWVADYKKHLKVRN